MSVADTEISARGFRAPGTTWMIGGSLLGAVGAYLFQVVGGRSLGTEAFAPIAALWTAFFILVTVMLVPLEQYVTRESSRGHRVLGRSAAPIVVLGAVTAGIGAAFVLLTRERLFEGNPIYAVQMALMVAGYTVLFAGKGLLAGTRRFRSVGTVLLAESGIRLVLGIVLLQVRADAVMLGWAMAAAGLGVFVLPFWRSDAGEASPSAAHPTAFLGRYIVGSGASQLLLAGAPLGVAALGGSPALISVVFVTFTLYRAPLTLIYSLQGRILPMLVKMSDEEDHGGLRGLGARIAAVGGGLTLLAGAVGWSVGPEVVVLFFGSEFAPQRVVAALAAAGVMAASAAQVTGQVLVAGGRTGRLALAWVTGLVIAVLVAAVAAGSPDVRVALGFAIGELAAFSVVALQVLRSRIAGAD
jgi:O-antigen/teichoic acid export membrane protein